MSGPERTVSEFSSPAAEIEHLKAEVENLRETNVPSKYLGSLLHLGIAYLDNDDIVDAEQALREVRDHMTAVWGWQDLRSLTCMKSLVKLLLVNGAFDEASEIYQVSITGVRRTLGSEHPWTSELRNNAGCLCIRRNELGSAEPLLQSALKGKLAVFGHQHRTTFKTKCNLGQVYYMRRDLLRFETILQNTLEESRRIYGDQDEDTLAIARQLISFYFSSENAQSAHQLCRDLDIEPSPSDGHMEQHYDNLIPSSFDPGTVHEEISSFHKAISSLGPKISGRLVSTLNWTREKILKYAELSVNEFADTVGLPRYFDWDDLTDANTLLKTASSIGHEATVQMLLDKRDIQEDNEKEQAILCAAMHDGCYFGNVEVVKLFLNHKVDIQASDSDGRTALHKATQQGHEYLVEVLLEFGADINAQDTRGSNSLDEALSRNREPIIRLFMQHKGALLITSGGGAKLASQDTQRIDNTNSIIRIGMEATVVDFYVDTSVANAEVEEHRIEKIPVETYIWGLDHQDEEVLSSGTSYIYGSSSNDSHRSSENAEEDRGSRSSTVSVNSAGSYLGSGRSSNSDATSNGPSINGANSKNKAEAQYFGLENDTHPDFKWIHLPANNMSWAEALLDKIQAESNTGTQPEDLLKEELWRSRYQQALHSAVHSRFMKPWCRTVNDENLNPKSLVLFMPYIHWEMEDARIKMAQTIRESTEDELKEFKELAKNFIKKHIQQFLPLRKQKGKDTEQSSDAPDRLLLEFFLFNDPPLHIRRTLDQFHFNTTEDTEARDLDQVISRYFRKVFPEDPVPLVMVDQLWLWIINGSTIVTCFPQRWGEHPSSLSDDRMLNLTNVIDKVITYLRTGARDPILSASDLSEVIMAQCLGLNVDKTVWDQEKYPYLELFEYTIKHLADEETRCFNHFADRGKTQDKPKEKPKKPKKPQKTQGKSAQKPELPKENLRKEIISPSTLGASNEDIFDISREIELLKEVKDVREELKILKDLFQQQISVLNSYCSAANFRNGERPTTLGKAIAQHASFVEKLDDDANISYVALEHLLDLKQKQANVSEARTARISGNTITVFTIVTIIFLPASFMAAFLALPIAQFPKVDDNYELTYAVKHTMIITTALGIPFIILALYVNPILRIFKLLLRFLAKIYAKLATLTNAVLNISSFVAKALFYLAKHLTTSIRIIFAIFGLCFVGIQRLFTNRQRVVEHSRNYKHAKERRKVEGKEWSKRRYVVQEMIAWRKRQKEKNEEEPEVAEPQGGVIEEVASDATS